MAALALAGTNAGAQARRLPPASGPPTAATCGWSALATGLEPPVLALIDRRIAEDMEGYAAETARDGLAQLRRWLGDCDATAARQAVLELRRAYGRNASNPALQAALGVALARGTDVQLAGAEGHNFRPASIQSNAEREARRLLPQALDRWPTAELGGELAALALATRDESTLRVAADALKRLSARLPEAASVWTARAEVALARLEYGEAREAAGKAAELGDASGLRALGVARLERGGDPAEGARMYFEGLAAADEAALYRYHEDLAPLLSMDEELEWAGLEPARRGPWLRARWEWRASTAGRTVADRLAVHFGRIETAMTRYRRTAHYGARPEEAIVRDSLQLRLPYDDRGLLLIRHGEPDDIVRGPSGRMGPGREGWLYYGLAGGRAVFEFRKLKDWSDWVAAPPGECDPFVYMYGVGGLRGEAMYSAGEAPNSAWFQEFERGVLDWGLKLAVADPALATEASRCLGVVLRSRRQNPVLGGVPRGGRGTAPDPLISELPYIRLTEAVRRRDARAGVDEALATETAVPRFEAFVQALSSVYAFRGDEDRATLAAFLLLPAWQLTPRALDRGVAYPLRLSLAVEDDAEQRVQRLDTLITFGVARALGPDQYLRTAVQMPADPVLRATVRITVSNADHPEEGQMLVGTKAVPAWPGDGLSLSDLVVAQPGPGTWRRGAVSISPLPGHQLRADGAFRLFYEIYGVRPAETLRTRITVAPDTDPDLLSRLRGMFGDSRVLELSFSETAQPGADGTVQVERTITPSLEPGRYTLEVTVERPAGGSATTRTNILLLEKSGG